MIKFIMVFFNRFLLILLLCSTLTCSSVLAGSSGPLCAYLLARLNLQNNATVVDDIIDLIISAKKLKPEQPGNAYRHLLISNQHPGRTAHSPRDIFDSTVILTLPPPGAPTVWHSLSPENRLRLTRQLEMTLRTGEYDFDVSNSQAHNSTIAQSMRLMQISLLRRLDPTAELNDVIANGISPARFFRAASNGCRVGICSSANIAFAGLLAELGVPQSDLRLVAAKQNADSDTGHLWLELRDPVTNRWLELDGTPLTGRGLSRFFAELGLNPRTSNRQKYPHLLEEINDFLTPLSSR